MVSKMLENTVQVLSMIFLILGINKDVINKNHNELVKFGHEYRIHEIHEVGISICEPERHDMILI
jgi:predicted nucleotide-binding protein (sugar kinase/HSP70/actin superfamily)